MVILPWLVKDLGGSVLFVEVRAFNQSGDTGEVYSHLQETVGGTTKPEEIVTKPDNAGLSTVIEYNFDSFKWNKWNKRYKRRNEDRGACNGFNRNKLSYSS